MSRKIEPPRSLAERAERTRAVIARFAPKAFAWDKAATCIHLARSQMIAMGHRAPTIPQFRSAAGARKALAKVGHPDLRSLIGAMLPEIAPAQLWVGDIVLLPGEPFDAAAVYAGQGYFHGWHADNDAATLAAFTLEGGEIIAAYRL